MTTLEYLKDLTALQKAEGLPIELVGDKLALTNNLGERLSVVTMTDLFAPLRGLGVFLKWRF